MAYCTQQDIIHSIGKARVLQWSDDDEQGVIDDDIVDAAIVWADDSINAKLSQRFASVLPFATPPRVIFQIAVVFATWYLASRVQETGKLWKQRYNEAKQTLDMLASGAMDLIAADGTNLTRASEQGSPGVRYLPQINDDTELIMPTALLRYRTYNAGLIYP